MSVLNFNKKSTLNKCVYNDIVELVNNYSLETDNLSVFFHTDKNFIDILSNSRTNFKYKKKSNKNAVNKFYRVNIEVTVTDKRTLESCSKIIKFLDIPYYSQGLKINSGNRELVDGYNRSTGWIINAPKNITDSKSGFDLVFRDLSSEKTKFVYKKGKIFICKGKTSLLDLGVFLKALTKLSYPEIQDKLGDLPCINRSMIVEKSMEDSLVETAFYLGTYGKKDSKGNADLKSLILDKVLTNPTAVQAKIRNSVFNSKYIKLDSSAEDRYNYRTKFSNRVCNMSLFEDLNIGDISLSKGTILNSDILEIIDNTECDTLKVSNQSSVFEVKKYPYSGNKDESDMFTMLNMFACVIEGLGEADDTFSLENRQLITIDKMAVITSISNLQSICDSVSKFNDYNIKPIRILQNISLDSGDDKNGYLSLINKLLDQKENSVQSQVDTNIISVLSTGTKASTNFKGSKKSEGMVSIQPSSRGRTDPFDAPESQKMGLTQYRCVSTLCEDGQMKVPYIKVKNCKPVSKEPVYLLPYEDKSAFIAQFNEDFLEEKILVRHDNDFVFVDRDKVDYMEYSPYQGSGVATSQMPFPGNSAGKRINMWANESRQAVFIMGMERPIVSTGFDCFTDEGVVRAEDILRNYYEQNQYANITCSEEEFISKKIKLVSISSDFEKRNLKFSVLDDSGIIIIDYSIRFMSRNSVKNLSSYRIKYSENLEYSGKDIVVHDIFVDVNDYKVNTECTDFGGLDVKDADFSKGFSFGKNLVVGFKTFGSYTIEDSLVISRKIVADGSVTSVYIETFDNEARCTDDTDESFGFSYTNIPSHMNIKGIPAVGLTLEPGSLIMNKTITTKGFKNVTKDAPIYLPEHMGGEVVFSNIEVNDGVEKATVIIASCSEVGTGDKFCGRYGNKGVCGKVVDECDMPYDSETGLTLDICVNPLGVPARMNISQLIECLVAFCCKKKDEICIATPFYKGQPEFVKKLGIENDFKPKVLTDGRTGRKFDKPINVGIMYFLKLHHTTETKLKYCSLIAGRQPETLQPKKGVAQKLGEMEFWVLESAQVSHFEQICKSVLSDDVRSSDNLIRHLRSSCKLDDINNLSQSPDNPSNIWLQVYLRSNGLNIFSKEDNIGFIDSTSTKYEIGLLADSKCTSLGKPVKLLASGGKFSGSSVLHDASVFGDCSSSKTRVLHRDKWSYMPLGCEIINPFFICSGNHSLTKLIRCKYFKTIFNTPVVNMDINSFVPSDGDMSVECLLHSVIPTILKCEVDIVFGSDDKSSVNYSKAYLVSKDQLLDNITHGVRLKHITGLVELFRRYSIDESIAYYSLVVKALKEKSDNSKYISAIEDLSYAKSLKSRGYDFKDFIIQNYPVCPAALRPEINKGSNQNDFDIHYKNIISYIRGTDDIYKPLRVFFAISDFIGYYKEEDAPCLSGITPLINSLKREGKSVKTIMNKFASPEGSSKEKGFFRDKVQGKRILMSGRSSIVPADMNVEYYNEDDIDAMHCGIPLLMAMGMLEQFLESYVAENLLLPREGGGNDLSAARRLLEYIKSDNYKAYNKDIERKGFIGVISNMSFNEFKKFVVDYIEDQVIVFGRQPSLHELSMRGFYIKVVEGSAIKLNTLYCDAYNADFDGDQMYAIVAPDETSKKEILDRLTCRKSAMSPRNNSCVLQLKQDMLVGLYLCTMLKDNKLTLDENDINDYLSYSNVVSLRNDFYNGLIKSHQICCLNHDGKFYLSTVGRIVFNSYIVGGFTDKPFTNVLKIDGVKENLYNDLLFDGIISVKGGSKEIKYISVDSVQKYMMDNYDGITVLNMMDSIARLGFYCSDYYGLSVSLCDFVEDEVIDKYNEYTSELRNDIENAYIEGFITEDEKRQSILDIYTSCNKIIEDKITDLYDRDNNLFIMRDSGARGSVSQLNQSVGMIGIMMKNSHESFSVPVTGNYYKGLSSYENFISSFGTRASFAKTYDESPDSGYLTRIGVYLTSGFKIVEDTCDDDIPSIELERGDVYKVSLNGEDIDIETSERDNSVVLKLLEVCDNKTIICSDEILRKINHVLSSGKINKNVLNVLIRNNVTDFSFLDDKGNENKIKIIYHLSDMFKELLLFRYCAEDLPNLYKKNYISSKTIDYLDTHDIKRLKVSLMLNCRSVGGVCARCYGLKNNTKELPKVGEFLGIQSAQSVGQPASQLTMSASNSGGVAGSSVTNTVKLVQNLLKGSLISSAERAVCADVDGVVTLTNVGSSTRLECGKKNIIVDSKSVIVENGEFVKNGTPLTTGYISPNEVYQDCVDEDIIFKRQLLLLHLYYDVFKINNIDIFIRHFEVLTRCQSNLVTILEDESGEFIPGFKYDRQLVKKSKKKIKYHYNPLESHLDVVRANSGDFSLLGYQYQVKCLSKLFAEGRPIELKSGLDRSMIGADVSGYSTKSLPDIVPNEQRVSKDKSSESNSSDLSFLMNVLENVTNSSYNNSDVSVDFTLDNELEGMDIFSNFASNNEEVTKNEELESCVPEEEFNSSIYDCEDLDLEDEEDENFVHYSADDSDSDIYTNLDDLDLF